jgi:hypothetical protein
MSISLINYHFARGIAAASSEVLTEEIQRIARLRAQNIEQDIYSRILI